MSLVAWLALGVFAGLIANAITDGKRASRMLDMALGTVGAVAGGLMFWNFGGGTIRGFNVYSMVVAIIGAVVALLTYHALFVYSADGRD